MSSTAPEDERLYTLVLTETTRVVLLDCCLNTIKNPLVPSGAKVDAQMALDMLINLAHHPAPNQGEEPHL